MIGYKRIFVGTECENKCAACEFDGQPRESRPADEIRQELTDSGASDGVEFWGGDPAARADLIELARYAKRLALRRVKIVTNARAYSDYSRAQAAVEAGIHVYEVKLHGPSPAVHDAVTGVDGSFAQATQAIQYLKAIDRYEGRLAAPFIGLRVFLTAGNVAHAEQLVQTAVPLKVDRVTLEFADDALAMSDAVPYLMNAIETAAFNRLWVWTERLPHCVMAGYEHHVSESYAQPSWTGAVRVAACDRCELAVACPGPPGRYVEARGEEEFQTVTASAHSADIAALRGAR